MPPHPTDVIADDLARTYQAGAARLAAIVQAGLRRGLDPSRAGGLSAERGDATLAYRERQLRAAVAVLDELKAAGRAHAGAIVARSYGAGILAVDRTALGDLAELRPRFGGIHARAVDALAANMGTALERAVGHAGENVARVFARANAIDGALPVRGGPGGRAVSFIGRRVDDPWRKVGLDEAAAGLVTLDTRRQVTASMARRLVTDGVGDAVTGFVDRSGRRWSLDRYSAMVARTTTREAVSRGTVNRMTEHGLDLVTISSHAGTCDLCAPYDGETFSLDGATAGYDVLDGLPPFHPSCVHVVTPAAANLDDYIGELEGAAAETAPAPAQGPPAQRPPILGKERAGEDAAPPFGGRARASRDAETAPSPAQGPPAQRPPILGKERGGEDGAPPFGGRARASRDAETARRLEEQQTRALIDGDPGVDAEAELARDREHDRIGRMNKRAENRYLKDNLGEDLTHYIGLKWGREEAIRERFLAGELSVDDVEAAAFEQTQRENYRAAERELREQETGFRTGSIPCFVCGRRKPRPSSVCEFCGDDPVTYGGAAQDFDRAYGYSGTDAGQFGAEEWRKRLGGR